MEEPQPWNGLHMHIDIFLKIKQEISDKGGRTAVHIFWEKKH